MSSTAYQNKPNVFETFGDGMVKKFDEMLQDRFDREGKLQKSAIEQYNDMAKAMFKDAAYVLSPTETTHLQQEILNVLMWKPVADTLAPTQNIGAGMKTTKYDVWRKVTAPRETLDYEGGRVVQPVHETTEVELHGMDYDVHFSKPVIDASRGRQGYASYSPSIDVSTVRILTEWMVEYRDKYIFLGSAGAGLKTNLSRTGFLNDANLTDPGAQGAGGDDDITDPSDVYVTATNLANFLIGKKFEPPFTLHLSPGAMMQANKNKNATNGKSDMQFINELTTPGGVKMFDVVKMNPYMINSDTETNSTAAMAAFKPGFNNFRIDESYGIGYYPKPPQGLGIDGKILWGGQPIVLRPDSIAFVNALTVDVFAA